LQKLRTIEVLLVIGEWWGPQGKEKDIDLTSRRMNWGGKECRGAQPCAKEKEEQLKESPTRVHSKRRYSTSLDKRKYRKRVPRRYRGR